MSFLKVYAYMKISGLIKLMNTIKLAYKIPKNLFTCRILYSRQSDDKTAPIS